MTDVADGAAGTAQEVAERAAAAMERADAAARGAGVTLLEVGPGFARTTLTVGPQHLNGHGLCHGGYLFLLADAAHAFASNSHGPSAVASGADIVFLRPGGPGDVLVAEARERTRVGRTSVYDVTVRAGEVTIAEFRGRAVTVPGIPPLS